MPLTLTLLGYTSEQLTDLSLFEKHLQHYRSEEWDSGDAVLTFRDDEARCSLVILHARSLGFSFLLAQTCIGDQRLEMVPAVDLARIHDFTEIDDGIAQPIGSFMGPERALEVVREFYDDPKAIPHAVEWIATSQLDWPEP